MNITRLAIEKNRITVAFMLIIIIGGYAAYQNISRAMESSFVIRWALITTDFPGASPERVELLISEPIEKVVQETPELDLGYWIFQRFRKIKRPIYRYKTNMGRFGKAVG